MEVEWPERAGGVAELVAFDDTAGRVRGVRSDPAREERGGIGEDRVVVEAPDGAGAGRAGVVEFGERGPAGVGPGRRACAGRDEPVVRLAVRVGAGGDTGEGLVGAGADVEADEGHRPPELRDVGVRLAERACHGGFSSSIFVRRASASSVRSGSSSSMRRMPKRPRTSSPS